MFDAGTISPVVTSVRVIEAAVTRPMSSLNCTSSDCWFPASAAPAAPAAAPGWPSRLMFAAAVAEEVNPAGDRGGVGREVQRIAGLAAVEVQPLPGADVGDVGDVGGRPGEDAGLLDAGLVGEPTVRRRGEVPRHLHAVGRDGV